MREHIPIKPAHLSVNTDDNLIRQQIEELKKQLPKTPVRKKALPKFVTFDEYKRILQYCKTKKLNKDYLVAFILAFEAGMRISEIVGLKENGEWKIKPITKDEIDLQSNQIRIVGGKGGKDRMVPCPKAFNETALKRLPIKIPRRTLQYTITKIGREALKKEITFHSLRHGFGSFLAGSGRPLHEIQMLMGHSRLDTTGIYLHANPTKAIEGARDLF